MTTRRRSRTWLQLERAALLPLAHLACAQPSAAAAFLALLANAGTRNTLAITARQLATLIGSSTDTASSALQTLAKRGYIQRLPELGPTAIAINAATAWLDSRDHLHLAPFLDYAPFPPPLRATSSTTLIPIHAPGAGAPGQPAPPPHAPALTATQTHRTRET